MAVRLRREAYRYLSDGAPPRRSFSKSSRLRTDDRTCQSGTNAVVERRGVTTVLPGDLAVWDGQVATIVGDGIVATQPTASTTPCRR